MSSWNSSSLSIGHKIEGKSRYQATRFALQLKSTIMFGLFGKHAQILHIVRLRNIADDHAPPVFEVIKMVIWKLTIVQLVLKFFN